jgi:hypothetical protein
VGRNNLKAEFLLNCLPFIFVPAASPPIVSHSKPAPVLEKFIASQKVTCFFSFSHHAVCLFPGSSSPSEASLSSILILLTLGCSTEQAEYTHLEKEERERVGALMSTPPLNLPHLEELKYVYCKC